MVNKPYNGDKLSKLITKFLDGSISYYHLRELELQQVVRVVPVKSGHRGRPENKYELTEKYQTEIHHAC